MRKKITALLLISVMALLSGCGSNGIKFGTSGEGGAYTEIAKEIEKTVQASSGGIKFDIRRTAGSAANVRLLSQGFLDMAIAQADIVNDAYYGLNNFSKSYKGYKAIAGLYTEPCQIIVKAGSGIKTVDELQNKIVSVGETESGTEQNANQILSVYGLSGNLVNKVNLNYTEACEQLTNDEIDAFFCTLAADSPVLQQLSDECDIRPLSLSDAAVNKLLTAYNFYTECTIPAGTYHGQSEDANTVGVTAVLLASDKLNEEAAAEITKDIFETEETNLNLSPQEAVKGISIPFHKSAAQCYRDLWNIDVKISE